MTEVTGALVLDAPREKVYDFLADPRRVYALGVTRVEEIERVGEDRWRVKEEWRIWPRGKRLLDTEVTILESVRPSKLVYITSPKGALVHINETFLFEPMGEKTKLTLTVEYRPRYGVIGWVAVRLISRRSIDRAMGDAMKLLRAAVERS